MKLKSLSTTVALTATIVSMNCLAYRMVFCEDTIEKKSVAPSTASFKKSILIKGKRQPSLPKNDWKTIAQSGIARFEKYVPNTYICPAGVPTIGYGFTDKKLVQRNFVSLPEAQQILNSKFNNQCDIVRKHVKVELTEPQLYALASFTHNCGEGSLLQLINGKDRLNSGNYDSIPQIMPKYRTANGKVLRGLEIRRAWEVQLWKQS